MTRNNVRNHEQIRDHVLSLRGKAEQRLLAAICAVPTTIGQFGITVDWFTDPARRTVFLILSRYAKEHPDETDLNPESLVMFSLTDTVLAGRVHREGDLSTVDSVTEDMVRNLTEEGWHWKSFVDQLAGTVRDAYAERLATEQAADLLQRETDPERRAAGLEDIAKSLRELASKGEDSRQIPHDPTENQAFVDVDALWKEFPTSVFPPSVQRFIRAGARSIGCDESMIGGPLLVVCASCVGTSRKIMLKFGWQEPAILWLLIIAVSGDHKSPALELVYRAVREKQRRAVRKWEKDHQYWVEHQVPFYEMDLKEFRKGAGTGGPPPEKPEEPRCPRYIVDDTTIEALAPILESNPRGVLAAMDEAANWFANMERYKTGNDSGKWLELHGGRALVVDRKTGDRKTLYIPNAGVSVCAGIQPLIYLKRCRTEENEASGMSARFLIVQAPRTLKQWSDAGVDEITERAFADIVDRLLSLEMETVEDDPDPRPVVCRLTPEARSLFVTFYNEHAREQADLTETMSSTWSKLEAYGARLALTVHMIRWAAGEVSDDQREIVDATSMSAGIALVRWFANEARRVHSVVVESPEEKELRELRDWIKQQGGSTTPREMTRKIWRYRNKNEEARSMLSKLAKNHQGMWEHMNTHGRPSERFILSEFSAHRHRRNPEFQAERGTSVDDGPDFRAETGFSDPVVERVADQLGDWK